MRLLAPFQQAVCAVALAASLLSAGACKRGPDDTALATSVKARLAASVAGSNVDVTAQAGVVSLSGTVASEALKTTSQDIARGVEGVKEVRNHLQIVAPPAPADTSNDSALRNSVSANLAKYGVVGVSADAHAGVVTLTGAVSRDQLVKAMQAANEASPRPTRVDNQLVIR
jgi:hyperosmotically inducible protein